MPTHPNDQTSKARSVFLERAAERALDDPRKVDRATRIVRAAIANDRLTINDLIPEGDPHVPTP